MISEGLLTVHLISKQEKLSRKMTLKDLIRGLYKLILYASARHPVYASLPPNRTPLSHPARPPARDTTAGVAYNLSFSPPLTTPSQPHQQKLTELIHRIRLPQQPHHLLSQVRRKTRLRTARILVEDREVEQAAGTLRRFYRRGWRRQRGSAERAAARGAVR